VFCLAEFVRVISHPRLFDPPHSVDEAAGAAALFTEDRDLARSPGLQIQRL
jgi:hypothetical protein